MHDKSHIVFERTLAGLFRMYEVAITSHLFTPTKNDDILLI